MALGLRTPARLGRAAGALALALALGAGLGLGAFAAWPGPPAAPGRAEHVGTFVWHEEWRGFGGYSALELSADGLRFAILSDRTAFVRGRLVRDARGAVTAVEPDVVEMLLGAGGRRLGPERDAVDSEGLAVAANGATSISFERDARVRREGRGGAPPEALPRHPAWAGLPRNRGLEALAVDGAGALLAIPEAAGDGDAFPVYRLGGGAWAVAFTIPRGPYAVVGADVGPDGRLYVLERAFRGLGFRARVRRFRLDGSGEETLIATATGTHDNLEGIAAWHDGAQLRLTLVSDDNFLRLQRTEIVDYRLLD